jgi:hypothetical protein
LTTADQPDYTDSIAITVVDTPAPIEVNVTEQAAPVSVTFPSVQDVNIKSQTTDLSVDVTSVPANMTTVPSWPYIPGRSKSYENAAFVAGSSPATHSVNADLGRNGRGGWLINDGPGDLKFANSDDGTNYGDDATIKSGDAVRLGGFDMNKIRITWVGNCGYRILVV